MQRVDEVVGLLIEGKHYLVPTIVGSIGGTGPMQSHPIIGPRHYDVEFFGVHVPHYHLDLRFVLSESRSNNNHSVAAGRQRDGSLPPVVYKKMKCTAACVVLSNVTGNEPGAYEQLVEHFRGAQCGGSAKTGWVCPHKGMPLASQYIDPKWIITCPGHGLKIDSRTGKVV